jgi:hypothetical protein
LDRIIRVWYPVRQESSAWTAWERCQRNLSCQWATLSMRYPRNAAESLWTTGIL